MRAAASIAMLLMIGQARAEEAALPLNFQCEFELLISPQTRQFSKPTSVEVRAYRSGKKIDRIRVVDAGGILFPGGNMRVVKSSEATRLEAVDMPAERPGTWRGLIKDNKFIFDLDADGKSSVVHFALTADAKNVKGEHIAIWNATHQPDGMPQPLSGTGAGWCLPKIEESAAQ